MENNSNPGVYAVHILILIFSCALVFPAMSCFKDDWVMFGFIIIVLAIISFILGIMGIADENETIAKEMEIQQHQEEEKTRIKENSSL